MDPLKPEEFAEISKKRTKENRDSLKDSNITVRTITGQEIEFYRRRMGTGLMDQFFGLSDDVRPGKHWELNFSTTTKDDIHFQRKVSIDPHDFYLEQVEGLLDLAEESISSKRESKLDFVEKTLYEPDSIDFDTAIDWFDRRDEVDFEEFNEAVADEDLNLGRNEKVLEQTIDEYWEDLKQNPDISNEERVQRGLLLDTVKSLQSIAFQENDDFKETVDDYELFLRRFQPEQYTELVENEHDYEVAPVFRPEYYKAVAGNTGSCLAKKKYEEISEQHAEDPFTFLQAIGRDGELRGYIRSFVMEDDSGDNFLGIDTIEVPKKGGIDLEDITEYFEQEKDVLKAGVMGAIRMGDTLDLDYVAGRDARIRFGLRQGYSNTQKKLTYRKKGEAVPYYSVAIREEEEILGHYIPSEDVSSEKEFEDFQEFKQMMEERGSRRFNDFEDVYFELEDEEKSEVMAYGIKRDRVPGFDEFPNPDKQELRGFRTEEGWHTNHAYILMEYPN